MYADRLILYIVLICFDVETAREHAKLAILERLQLPIFFAPSQQWLEAGEDIFLRNFTKTKM